MNTKVLLLPVMLVALLQGSFAQTPFTMNGWQFHEYNIPKLEEAVAQAPGYGVNFFIFSHEFFRSVEGFLASTDDADPRNPPASTKELHTPEYFRIIPGWQSDLRHIGDLATAKGIPYYLWVHEFDDVPKKYIKDNRLDMDDPGLLKYIEQRYERLLKAVPGTAGFVLTLHECDFKLFRNTDIKSKLSMADRIYTISKLIYDVAKRHKKQFILRDFFYEPLEVTYWKEALAKLPDDVIVMNKPTWHEFHPFYPSDSLHGQVGKKKQLMEIDLGVENAWSSQGAYAQTEYIQRYVRRAKEKGLTGMVGRARLFYDKPFEDNHEVNFYAFSQFMENPARTVDEVLTSWAQKKYPRQAVPYIVSAMKRTQFINHRGRWPLAFWLTKSIGDEWGDYVYYFGHILLRSRYKWTKDPADKTLETKLYYPDMDTYHKLVAEKDEVISQVRESLLDLRQARRSLTAKQYEPLAKDFDFLLDAALLQKEWIRAFYAQRLYMGAPKEEYKMMADDALKKLEERDQLPGVTYGLNPETGHRYNIEKFVVEMRWRMLNRARALKEDERILADVRKEMDVENN